MEHRGAFRHPTDLDADCRAGERAWTTRLRNISTGGCMIVSPDPGFAVGTPLRVWIRGVPTIDGAIAWQHRDHAGIRFSLPLTTTVMEQLGFPLAAAKPLPLRRTPGLSAGLIKRPPQADRAA